MTRSPTAKPKFPLPAVWAGVGAALLLALIPALGAQTTAPNPRSLTEARVTSITDGDTFRAQVNGNRERIRMLRIDTPERNDKYYRDASRALQRLIENKTVRLEFEGRRKDPNGRLLAYVWLDDKNINLEMVRLGWTPFDARFGEGKYATQFRAAERSARDARIGIWR